MSTSINLSKRENETELDYKKRIFLYKDVFGFTWGDIADIINEELNLEYSPDKYRKEAFKVLDKINVDALKAEEKILEYNIEKSKLNEQRTQVTALTRRIAREETLKEIAHDVAKEISESKVLDIPETIVSKNEEKKAILCIGDWHYGLDVAVYFNQYNPDIAVQRVNKLILKVIELIQEHSIDDLYVINLGDMISGRIHLPLRINSRIDTVSQTMIVSEIISEFLTELSKHTKVNYISVTDNHSRIEPYKTESLQLESFSRIIDWFLKERLSSNENIIFLQNMFSDDIAIFNVFNHSIVGVHGDKDSQKDIIDKLNSYLQGHIDMILSAHKHHFSANENNNTEFYCNGSLMGTDDYASNLRLNSRPSQLFFVCTPENVSEIIYKIKL